VGSQAAYWLIIVAQATTKGKQTFIRSGGVLHFFISQNFICGKDLLRRRSAAAITGIKATFNSYIPSFHKFFKPVGAFYAMGSKFVGNFESTTSP
jgi:hypothetical protein